MGKLLETPSGLFIPRCVGRRIYRVCIEQRRANCAADHEAAASGQPVIQYGPDMSGYVKTQLKGSASNHFEERFAALIGKPGNDIASYRQR